MRGTRAKELRREARRVLGPEAPAVAYDFPAQRGSTGGPVARAVFTDAKGLPYQARIRAEYFDIGAWRWVRCWIKTGLPVFRTLGLEPRLTLSCVKGLTAKFKAKYRRIART